MPQFDISTFSSQIFWLILAFGVLYIVVLKYIAPKAENILTERNRYIDDNIKASEEFTARAQALKDLKEQKIIELNFEAEEIRSHAISALEEYFTKKKEDLALGLAEKTKESNAEINKYVKSFHTKELGPSVKLASFIVEKITDKPADVKLLEKIYSEN